LRDFTIKNIRNIGLFGHRGNGKTSLSEAMLYTAHKTTRMGTIGKGTTIMDFMPEEIERKTTIGLSIAWLEWDSCFVNLVDTPGYGDFFGDTLSALRAVDAVILVIDAAAGAGIQTERVYKEAQKLNLPILIFINKMRDENANFPQRLREAELAFGKHIAPLYIPIGSGKNFDGVVNTLKGIAYLYKDGKRSEEKIPESIDITPYRTKLMDAIVERDDQLLEKYLSEEKIEESEIEECFRAGELEGAIIPVICGDALSNRGIDLLLDTIAKYLPRAEDKDKGGLVSFVFKTTVDPHIGDMRYIRVFSGKIEAGSEVFNATKGGMEKINQLYIIQGKEREEVKKLPAGSMGAAAKLKITKSGDTLSDKSSGEKLPAIQFPEPQVSIAIVPKTRGDEATVSTGLSKLREEDPSFSLSYDAETKQHILKGIGEIHLDSILARLKRKYGVNVLAEKPKIHYRETILKRVEAQGKFKKQTGGHGQYGDCWIRIEPVEKGKGFEFVNQIKGGAIPAKYLPSIEKGIKEAMAGGMLANYPVVDIKATCYDGTYHPVDSSDIAFKIAASLAFKNAAEKASPILLEPILNVEVEIPEEYLGDVMGDLNSRRGKILGTESVANKYQKIKALVPESELYGYSASLRSITQGRGSFHQSFSHYEQVPLEIQKKIVEERKKG
jgi:elongation factor G